MIMDDQDQRSHQLERLAALRAAGRDPFAIERYPRSHEAASICGDFDSLEGKRVRICGRIVAHRPMGKAAFAHLQDESGRVQIYAKRDVIGEESYEDFKRAYVGDFYGVEGTVFRTRTGEPTVEANELTLLSMCFRTLPIGKEREGEHYSSLHDVEQRYRMRYVDLLANPEAAGILRNRSKIVTAIRHFLDEKGFLEVETPVLQTEAGGASARPFKSHHNALDFDFKLRISLELFLKRLLVGGFEKVYEIGRVFRNEGISTRHNPEFTLLEIYQAYANLEDIMELVEEMYVRACTAVNGSPRFESHRRLDNGETVMETIDLGCRPWRRLRILDGISQYAGVHPDDLRNLESAREACERIGIPAEREHTVGGIIEKLHERFTQPHLIQPAFITDFPIETSPLAKKRQDNPALTRRFEVYSATQELGNAFSEINDPFDQRERFEDQAKQRAAGDEETHPMDEDFLRALEFGMPPTGGLGVGIDRLVMILTGATSIRDVILFPLMRPEKSG